MRVRDLEGSEGAGGELGAWQPPRYHSLWRSRRRYYGRFAFDTKKLIISQWQSSDSLFMNLPEIQATLQINGIEEMLVVGSL